VAELKITNATTEQVLAPSLSYVQDTVPRR